MYQNIQVFYKKLSEIKSLKNNNNKITNVLYNLGVKKRS